MIKLLKARCFNGFKVELLFSNGVEGVFDASAMLKKQGFLLQDLKDDDFFKRGFVDAGALCWPNGLELSPSRLYQACSVVEAA